MKQSLAVRFSTVALLVFLAGVLLAQQSQVPSNSPPAKNPGMSAAEDRKRMLELLGLPTTDGPFPLAAEDPKRPQLTTQRGRGGTNWYDEAGNTYVRSNWGNWSNYDEAKANPYPLPDPLVLKNGQPVKDADTWWKQRRPEILNDFLTEIYGKIPENTPKVTWEVIHTDPNALGGTAIMKTLVGHIDNSTYPAASPSINITMYTPAKAAGPVPLMMVVGGGLGGMGGGGATSQVLALGWGYATMHTGAIQADSGAGLTSGIIGLVNKGQPRKTDDWGVLAAWSWGLSQALDYFETDESVDARQVGLEGHSRWGKEALIAMALDPRFAIVYSSCSGAVGAKLSRRNWGETVDNVAGTGEYHWMAGNFLKYGGRWDDMPVDAHELIALCAPRPVFVTGGTNDQWCDPRGEFLACVGAGPVYRLLGKKDLGTTEMPAPDVTLDSGEIAFRMHNGGHTDAPDWPAFLNFAQRYLKAPANGPAGRGDESKVLDDTSPFGKSGPVKSGASGSGAFNTGTYRNLFAEAGHLQQEVNAKINAAFQQLFHGDPNTQAVYFPAGTNAHGPLAYLMDINNNDVRSEGMSYGMMIAVQLNKKAEFDALWNWAKTYMYHDSPGHPGQGYFSWSVRTNGTPNSEMPAPDGEEYFAMSLYFAAGRWGNGTGIYDYQTAADRLLTDMVHRRQITSSTSRGTRTGREMFSPEHTMVRFSPDSNFTDPSYHLPAFYELWFRWGPETDRPFWARTADVSRDFFQKVTNSVTGLAPDYAHFDGTLRGGQHDNFQYDAWRTTMNWSVDWAWWAKDARERQLSDRLQAFFEAKGLADYGNRFTLDGNQLAADHSTGLVAMNAVASLAATHPRARQFVEALWNSPIPSGRFRYYDGMLYLMGLLHCSGEFRVWPPR